MRAAAEVLAAALALSLAGAERMMLREGAAAQEDDGRDIGAHQFSTSSRWGSGDEMECEALKLTLGESVASGAYGAVYRVQGDASRAVKIAFSPKQGVEAEIEGFRHECAIMRRLQGHASVPQCHAWCSIEGSSGPTEALVMDFIPNAVAMWKVRDAAKEKNSEYKWKEIGKQIYQSLVGMLSQGITNTDQTSNNIVVEKSTSKVYFIDMGKAIAEEAYPGYCSRAKRAGIIRDKQSCDLLRIWHYNDTMRPVFKSIVKRGDCPKAGARGAEECEAAAAQLASGVAEAFCEDKYRWHALRFFSDDKTKWCRYVGTQRRAGSKFRYDNTCLNSESDTYLLWDAEAGVKSITDPRSGSTKRNAVLDKARTAANQCFDSGGTESVGDDDVPKLPAMLWRNVPFTE